MGDGFDLSFRSINTLPFPGPSGHDIPWGIRLMPGARLNTGWFFAELRLEGGAAYDGTTPIQANYFLSQPSGAISDKAPLTWVYRPTDPNDPLRGNFGFRSASIGARFLEDFQIRLGRHRFEQTEYENLFTNNAYSAQYNYANVTIPLHWIGAEIRYDRRRPNENLRQLLFSAGVEYGADKTVLGMAQGLFTYAFEPGASAPRLTLTAYGAIRSNPQPDTGPRLPDPGITSGQGLGLLFDYGIFTGGAALTHRYGSSHDSLGIEATDERSAATILLDVHPGDWRFRGAISFLNRANASDSFFPSIGQNETHTELTVNYQPIEGLMLTAGYRGAYGGVTTHMGFVGIQTSFQHLFPFPQTN